MQTTELKRFLENKTPMEVVVKSGNTTLKTTSIDLIWGKVNKVSITCEEGTENKKLKSQISSKTKTIKELRVKIKELEKKK